MPGTSITRISNASRSEVEKFAAERRFRSFLETSAKKNLGREELKQAILAGINWDEIPCRTTEVLFKRLKEEIIRLKDEGRVLMRFNELRETLQLGLSGEFKRFGDDELRAVLTLLAGPGVVSEGRVSRGPDFLLDASRSRVVDSRSSSLRLGQLGAAPAGAHQRLRAGRDPDVAGGRASARLPDGGAGLEGRPGV